MSEPLTSTHCSLRDDLALAVALLARLLVLGQEHADESNVGAAGVDVLARGDLHVAGDRLADAHGILDRDHAVQPVARAA